MNALESSGEFETLKSLKEYMSSASEDALAKPSAYIASIPLGFALYSAFDACQSQDLLAAWISAWSKESLRNTEPFLSIKTFTPVFVPYISQYAGPTCASKVLLTARELELID